MRRVVFDTNLIASGVVGIRRDESTPGALLRRWFERRLTLVMSEHLLDEVERALAKPYVVAHTTPADRALVLSTLREQATWTDVTTVVAGVATHLADNLVLATALSAHAEYLVTVDQALQRLHRHQTVTILSPRELLTLLDEQMMSDEE